jgi:hypothetical protein
VDEGARVVLLADAGRAEAARGHRPYRKHAGAFLRRSQPRGDRPRGQPDPASFSTH